MIKKEWKIRNVEMVVSFLINENFNRKVINKALKMGDVKINGKRIKEDSMLMPSDELVIFYNEADSKSANRVLFENDDVVIAVKGRNIVSAKIDKREDEKAFEEIFSAKAVHRLDRITEGIIIMAKNEDTEKSLLNAFKNRLIEKSYLAEIYGDFKHEGERKAYLLKNADESKVKIYDTKVKDSVEIVNHYKKIKSAGNTSLVEINLITGKTHQIRAHLAYLKNFILGDNKYGVKDISRKYKAKQLRLTAYKVKFNLKPTNRLSYLNDLNLEIVPDFLSNMKNT